MKSIFDLEHIFLLLTLPKTSSQGWFHYVTASYERAPRSSQSPSLSEAFAAINPPGPGLSSHPSFQIGPIPVFSWAFTWTLVVSLLGYSLRSTSHIHLPYELLISLSSRVTVFTNPSPLRFQQQNLIYYSTIEVETFTHLY